MAEKATSKRYNLSDSFEEIYLRERTLKRFLADGDIALMSDIETCKVIEHLTDRQMSVYGRILSWNGFDRDDVRSIVSIFCLCFTGVEKLADAKSKKDYYYLMMNFTNQRMEYFISCVMRKFQVSDVVTYNVASNPTICSQEELIDGLAEEVRVPADSTDESEMSMADNIEHLEDQLEIIKLRFVKAGETGKLDEADALKQSMDRMEEILGCYRDEYREELKSQKSVTVRLRKQLDSNPKEHSEKLCYYATYKGIPYDVRRAARNVCRRYGIDYLSWARSKADRSGYSEEVCFDLR